ncbi:MAG TPA: HIRAN domain-containing protein, partial [Micromonospora sp.]
MTRPFDLWGQRGWCAQEVVGESDFAAEIRSLFGPGFDPEGSEITVQAQLIPDPTNRFDPDAVKVLCSGQQVGYLPREHAGEYAPVLAALLEQGWTPQVQAEVWAQERQDPADPGRRTFVGAVRLDLREPHMIVPVNRPPAERHAVLPTGRMVPVTGDERQLAHLGSLMGEHPESWVYVTLHEQGPTRSPRPLVEVRLDGV